MTRDPVRDHPDGWFLLGAPWDCSGSGRGEQLAPAALRAAGLADLTGTDLGDAPCTVTSTVRDHRTGVLALPDTLRAAGALADALGAALGDQPGRRPLVVGGDCSILLGIFMALRGRVGPVGLWFVDGHPDFLDGRTSETGEVADMDLAVLTGHGAEPLVTLAGAAPMVAATDAVLIGHRTHGLDAASAAEVAALPPDLVHLDASTVAVDPAGAGRRAVDRLGGVGSGAWLHVDLDVLDPASLPAVTYPQEGGLDWEQLEALISPMARSPRLVGMSVADFRPDLDPDGDLARRIVAVLSSCLP